MKITGWRCFLLISGASFCMAQQPEFEVASVKLAAVNPDADAGLFQQMGGDPAIENYTNIDLRTLIVRAYQIKDSQLSGPDWMRETFYNIRAKIPEGVSHDQVPVMLRKLL